MRLPLTLPSLRDREGRVRGLLGIAAALLIALCTSARAVTIEPVESARGVTAWLVEDHSIPVVTITVDFRGGAALDPAGKAGLASLTCDLLDEGAGALDSSAYQGRLEDLATRLSFGAGEDATGVSLRSVTQNLAPALALLKLALARAALRSSRGRAGQEPTRSRARPRRTPAAHHCRPAVAQGDVRRSSLCPPPQGLDRDDRGDHDR